MVTAPHAPNAARPGRADVVIAVLCVLTGLANTFWSRSNGLLTGHVAAAAVVAGVTGACVVLRRTFPPAVAGPVTLAHLTTFTPAAFAVMMYTLGHRYRRRRAALVAVAVAGTVVHAGTVAVNVSDPEARGIAYTLAFVIGPLALGSAAGLRHDLTESLRHQAQHLEKEQRLTAEHARDTERARIAREMHDVVSHRVSHVVLSAGALEVTARLTTDHVAEQARQIRTYGQQALADLRDILGVLHAAHTPGMSPRTPQPTLRDLPELIDSARTAGQIRVDLTMPDGADRATLPDTLQRAVYRVVQESLTNALKHAPGAPVAVTLGLTGRHATVEVVNEPPHRAAHAEVPGSGSGLVGLAERVRLLGGTFTAGQEPGGGFRTHASIPVPAAGDQRGGCGPDRGPVLEISDRSMPQINSWRS
ncbi:sensor histidine kinase [Streptomyces rectiverticillatus]|uniref:sensor histidine kinase n=1 Tax=Streptomyces rectiverticillatus TaxID=173860 RepID=UPI0015C3AE86|nr:histidine kinase [Streptomyces rectiverticillatus]